ncbi:hypothetical protein [Bacillus atrophaeus]|uniref:hypothetical protein n=1 Tax=Bacillus atrophaeus TaxID=1452 RepID=UPI002DB7F2D4|nr:hypothetical protein [Bacillus atrophaeus]MEC2309613.1 hypothetical protein [Bacillus atrophaeus]
MKNFQWITTLLNAKKQPLLSGKRNRGIMWVSLLGLGVSLVTIGLRKKNNQNMLQPIQNLVNNFKQNNLKTSIPISNSTEFSNELTTNIFKTQNNPNNEKNNINLSASQNK